MLVADILRNKGTEVFTISPGESLHEISRLLTSKRIGSLVVTDETGRVVGIVSERDIVRVVAMDGPGALGNAVATVMSREVATCAEEDTIASLMSRMTVSRVRHLPVVRGGKLIGIISIGDVVKHRMEEAEGEARAMRDYITTGAGAVM